MPNLSICISVWNEYAELSMLLERVFASINDGDEVIVQGDQGKVTSEVVSVIREYTKRNNFVYLEYPLNRDFATFKNNAIKHATKDYILWLDADEYLSQNLITIYRTTLELNDDAQAFAIPRANVVIGLEQKDINAWGWSVQQKPTVEDYSILKRYGIDKQPFFVNWPDYQLRLWKNGLGICYNGNVHERLQGFTRMAYVEMDLDFCLWHIKKNERQRSQNAFYENCLQ